MSAASSVYRRWRLVAASLGVLAALVVMPQLVSRPDSDPWTWSELTIDAPSEVRAGESFMVTISGAAGETVTLSVDAGIGPRLFHAVAGSDAATFVVPASAGPEAGVVTLVATADRKIGDRTIRIVPGEPRRPDAVFVGSRTQSSTSGEATMAVIVPTDHFGNALPDGTPVSVRNDGPSGDTMELTIGVEAMIAWTWLDGGRRAGDADVRVAVDGDFGPRRSYTIHPTEAAPFGLEVLAHGTTADGSEPTLIATEVLIDPWGNQLLDGTLATAIVDGPEGISRINSVIIDGVARFSVAAPSRPGTSTIWVEAGSTISDSVTLTHLPVAAEIATHWDGATLVIGPVLDDDRPVPDATLAEVLVNGQVIESVQLLDGVATVEPKVAAGPGVGFAVRVLGITTAVAPQ